MVDNIIAGLSLLVSIISGIASWKANKKSTVMAKKLQKLEMRQSIMPYFNLAFNRKNLSKQMITEDGFNFSLINVGNMTAVNILLNRKEKTSLKINTNVTLALSKTGRTKNKFAFPKDKVEIHLNKKEIDNKKTIVKIFFNDVMGREYSQNIYLMKRYDSNSIDGYRSCVDDPVLIKDELNVDE